MIKESVYRLSMISCLLLIGKIIADIPNTIGKLTSMYLLKCYDVATFTLIGIAIGAGAGVFAVMAVILVGVILIVLCCRVRHNSETYV